MLVVRAATKSPASSKNAKALTDDAELCDAASTRLTGTNSWPLSCASLPFVPIAETLFGMILCTFIKFESFNLKYVFLLFYRGLGKQGYQCQGNIIIIDEKL